ncbi:MAG: hypothetical protein ACOYMG_19495, partial [Candidatus Methylumidiphilus sp.]
PQNKNFQALEELQMVLGVNAALYKKLEPLLTIYTGQDGINPQKASGETLKLLFGLDEKTVAEFLNQRRMNPPNTPAPPLNLPPGGVPINSTGNNAFTIYAQARIGSGPGAGLKVVARRGFSPNNGAPFSFFSWKQQILGAEQTLATEPNMLR